jgi:hypothetical protein
VEDDIDVLVFLAEFVTHSVHHESTSDSDLNAYNTYLQVAITWTLSLNCHHLLQQRGTPPTGTLSVFNLYVALSRSAGRHSIRLLRDFDSKLFKLKHDQKLLDVDARLESLDAELR